LCALLLVIDWLDDKDMKNPCEMKTALLFTTAAWSLAFLPNAHAFTTNTPLDCPGVVAVKRGYELTQDTLCPSQAWGQPGSTTGNGKVLNLNGFTLELDRLLIVAANFVIRHGVLRTNGIYWNGASGELSDLTITSASTESAVFFIEAGPKLTVRNSTFTNIPGIAIDFYYGEGGVVRNSVFTGNYVGVSIQKSSNVVIENSKFLNNGRGVNLWNEDWVGVNSNTVRRNVFERNEVGINLSQQPSGFDRPSMQGNRLEQNQFSGNKYAGIVVKVFCHNKGALGDIVCSGQNTVVSGNRLLSNGFGSSVDGLDDGVDDGITARGVIYDASSVYPYSNGLVGVVLSNNRADRNADLGFDVFGVTDGGGNSARLNGNPAQCDGILCRTPRGLTRDNSAITLEAVTAASKLNRQLSFISVFDQLNHEP
jgi:hypothetical protein